MACGEGTTLQGSDKLKCVEGASGWDWDGTWPICKDGKIHYTLNLAQAFTDYLR